MQIKPHLNFLFLFLTGYIISSCSAPRSMLNSGKVLEKGQIRTGINNTINISSASIERSIKTTSHLAGSVINNDTIIYSEQIANLNSALLAYSLDPISYNNEFYFRYGLGHRLDIGYKNSGDANAFDVMFQFLGSEKSLNETERAGFYGSIGTQYSWQSYSLISFSKFLDVQKLFGWDMKRKDITVPLVFSQSFGPDERYGCFSFGVIYSHSFINYKMSPENIYVKELTDNIPAEIINPISRKTGFNAYGTFFNIKIGKKYVFFNFSLAAYYQNYGRYPLIGGNTVSLKGVSIVPSYGVQFNIFPKSKKSREAKI